MVQRFSPVALTQVPPMVTSYMTQRNIKAGRLTLRQNACAVPSSHHL